MQDGFLHKNLSRLRCFSGLPAHDLRVTWGMPFEYPLGEPESPRPLDALPWQPGEHRAPCDASGACTLLKRRSARREPLPGDFDKIHRRGDPAAQGH